MMQRDNASEQTRLQNAEHCIDQGDDNGEPTHRKSRLPFWTSTLLGCNPSGF
jgi:hypothetical protein